MDNRLSFKKAMKWLEEKYKIRGITISSYNLLHDLLPGTPKRIE